LAGRKLIKIKTCIRNWQKPSKKYQRLRRVFNKFCMERSLDYRYKMTFFASLISTMRFCVHKRGPYSVQHRNKINHFPLVHANNHHFRKLFCSKKFRTSAFEEPPLVRDGQTPWTSCALPHTITKGCLEKKTAVRERFVIVNMGKEGSLNEDVQLKKKNFGCFRSNYEVSTWRKGVVTILYERFYGHWIAVNTCFCLCLLWIHDTMLPSPKGVGNIMHALILWKLCLLKR